MEHKLLSRISLALTKELDRLRAAKLPLAVTIECFDDQDRAELCDFLERTGKNVVVFDAELEASKDIGRKVSPPNLYEVGKDLNPTDLLILKGYDHLANRYLNEELVEYQKNGGVTLMVIKDHELSTYAGESSRYLEASAS